MGSQEFNDKLREAATVLALGEQEEINIPMRAIAVALEGKKSADNPASYIRSIMSRVPEVKERGTIKVRKGICQDADSDYFGMEVYTVALSKQRRTVYTKQDMKRARMEGMRKTAERLLTWAPNLNNYQVGEYGTVAKLTAEFAEMVKVNFLNGEEE